MENWLARMQSRGPIPSWKSELGRVLGFGIECIKGCPDSPFLDYLLRIISQLDSSLNRPESPKHVFKIYNLSSQSAPRYYLNPKTFNMKFNLALLFAAAQITGVFSAAVSDAKAAEECGELGVMPRIATSDLPEGVTQDDIRMCADHPLGRDRHLDEASLAPSEVSEREGNTTPAGKEADSFQDMACEWGAPYGCTRGYCWKSCGDDGQWCWTANKAGLGSWITCDSFHDCGTVTYACGRGGIFGGCGC